ncbi:hypothetical protein VPH35_129477 [Triticum aestivum]
MEVWILGLVVFECLSPTNKVELHFGSCLGGCSTLPWGHAEIEQQEMYVPATCRRLGCYLPSLDATNVVDEEGWGSTELKIDGRVRAHQLWDARVAPTTISSPQVVHPRRRRGSISVKAAKDRLRFNLSVMGYPCKCLGLCCNLSFHLGPDVKCAFKFI